MGVIEAALQANRVLYRRLRTQGLHADDHLCFGQGAGGDRSSAIDLEAERIFIEHLLPFGTIISEESGTIENPYMSSYIVLDPIDGSDNLLSHLPYYGTSVAYFEEGKCTKAVIANLANGDCFMKDQNGLKRAHLDEKNFSDVWCNPFSKVGIFERAYASSRLHPLLQKAGLKYRSPGAFALSLAYAREVSFVLYEGAIRSYDVEAGRFMCEDLYLYETQELFLVSKDKEIFDRIINLFISN
ncbi:inositol monophosphatase family protein [Sulfurospirillum cavolei]|uniref:inositol monophosphatase family protein n=1 Tax=Sulfurospirillum cavolei TaxID=366522 RepID=UPI003FA2E4F5